jgi:hypothetical protein
MAPVRHVISVHAHLSEIEFVDRILREDERLAINNLTIFSDRVAPGLSGIESHPFFDFEFSSKLQMRLRPPRESRSARNQAWFLPPVRTTSG